MAREGRIADYEPATRDSGILVLPGDATNRLEAADLAMIQERVAMQGVFVDKETLWGFRAIASTDALDTYYTRPHVETALVPYVADLQTGTTVLGNHDYRKFGYGSSYDGELVDVEPKDWFYEKDERFMAHKGALGKYFIVKGVTVNGEKTDELIKLMQYGAARRVSISFLPERYDCSICGKDLLAWECEHMPGVRYGDDDDLCYGWIVNSRLLETSVVFRNAAPDAMLQRKLAEGFAQGEVPFRYAEALAQRFALAGPSWRSFVITNKLNRGGTVMAEDDAAQEHDDPASQKPDEQKPDEQKPDEQDEESSFEAELDMLSATDRGKALEAILASADKEEVAEFAARVEDQCASLGIRLPSQLAQREFEARVREALGVQGHADTITSAKEVAGRAALGDKMFGDLVDRAVKARVSAGQKFDEDAYRGHLMATRDSGYVTSELAAWEELRKERWYPGRKVSDPDSEELSFEEPPAPPESNVFEALAPKDGPGSFAILSKQKK